jgi:predicted GNAT family acetyltransferase
MIHKCGKERESAVFEYIGNDYSKCLYLYLNLIKYGADSDVVRVYVQEENSEIKAVLLVYFSCLHVYTKDCSELDASGIISWAVENHCSMIYCKADIAEKIYENMAESLKHRVIITQGWAAQIKDVDKKCEMMPVPAKNDDFEQIVNLIYEDEDIGKSYKLADLAQQLRERNQQKYARNYVIKHDGEVIAHACTNAEISKIAVVAELLVKPAYRRRGYASAIWRYLCSELLSEGKEVYSFYYSEESRSLHKKIGFFEVCEWKKIVILNQERGE